MRGLTLGVLTVATLVLDGCWFRGKPKPQLPPTPAQAPRAAPTNRPSAGAKSAPAKRTPATPSTSRAAQPAAPPKATEPKKTPPPPKPPDPQHLGRILSPEEAGEYRAAYERSSSAAFEMLASLSGRQLPSDTRDSIGRIRSFLAQAKEATVTDWPAAAHLAYRAEVLARDLVRMLQ